MTSTNILVVSDEIKTHHHKVNGKKIIPMKYVDHFGRVHMYVGT